jgi:hypothetical protein
MRVPKIYGYGVATLCLVFAATRAPGLTHHQHWKAALIWVAVATGIAIASALILGKKK